MNKKKNSTYIKPATEIVSVDADVIMLNGSDENTGTAPGHGGEFNSLAPGYSTEAVVDSDE